MEEQQPERESEVIDPARAGTWPRTSAPGVTLGELFGSLAFWKSAHGRETLPPLQARQRDLCSAPTAADSTGSDPADGTTASPADSAIKDTADGAPDGAADAPGASCGGSGVEGAGAAGAAVGGSMLDWLEVSADAAERALGEPVWRYGGGGLGAAMGLIGRLRNTLERLEVAVAGEVEVQGVGNERGLSAVDWLVDAAGAAAPRPDVQHVCRVLNVARAIRAGQPGAEVFGEAVGVGAMPLVKADLVSRFVADVRAVADPDALAADVEALVEAASDNHRGRGLSVRELRRAIGFATQLITPAEDLERDEQRRRLCRSLHKSRGPAGMSRYQLILDPEGAAILDSAVAALSAPVKGPDGQRDPRPAATRRADALLEVIRRGVSAPGKQSTSEKAQIIVTIPLAHLQDGCRGAGLTMSGELLSPAVLRRMACDARLIPMVLGGRGEVLDIGDGDRLFTPAQRKAVWHRDHQCTFPGCTIPAQWTDVHHVAWWSRGGLTDLSNAALLCGRHHTLVHQRDLTATVTDTGVTWNV